jgi:hypothetical protein
MKPNLYWKVTQGNDTFFISETERNRYLQLHKALKNFPLDEFEDFSKLSDSKLHKFYLDLNDEDMEFLNSDGTVSILDSDTLSEVMFQDSLMQFILKWNLKFNDSEYKNFKLLQSKKTKLKLNRCLAYFAACNAFLSWILEESRFHSLPLILDSISEIEASFVLSANFYYKQSVQLLRNFLELVVAQYFFSSNTLKYDDWRTKPDFKMPMFRGKNGMIKYLLKNGKIDSDEEKTLDNLFGTLSAYTHSRYEKLVHMDPKTGKSIPFDYNERYLEEWIELAINCMEIGLIILSKHTEDWKKQLEDKDEFSCSVCHKKEFEITKEKYGVNELFVYTCKNCDNQVITDTQI